MPESLRFYCSGCLMCAVNLALWVSMGVMTLPAFESGALPTTMAWLPWAGAALAAKDLLLRKRVARAADA